MKTRYEGSTSLLQSHVAGLKEVLHNHIHNRKHNRPIMLYSIHYNKYYIYNNYYSAFRSTITFGGETECIEVYIRMYIHCIDMFLYPDTEVNKKELNPVIEMYDLLSCRDTYILETCLLAS